MYMVIFLKDLQCLVAHSASVYSEFEHVQEQFEQKYLNKVNKNNLNKIV